MLSKSQIVFKKHVLAGNRIYFINIKEGRRGLYLVFTEAKSQDRERNNRDQNQYQSRNRSQNQGERHQIMIFPEDVEKIQEALNSGFEYAVGDQKEEQVENQESQDDPKNSNIVFKKHVLAGNRIYFVNVKEGRRGLYLVFTEARRQDREEGNQDQSRNRSQNQGERHQIMIFPEDVEKIQEALNSGFEYIRENSNEEQRPAEPNTED